ncbi:flagellar basal body-associated FliL family protein [Stappia indica]|uniref:Flagellar protein FliL n=1 Tax=Stappia indica TaxID=538381 RepID=A0A285R5K9_9HYPH|nr:flagellar basal body-associated FliL family protein [Stappia indica]MCC4243223.1 flagellar basal body-associated FliL family protein [Stappia indica]SOB89164.1 flagellar FliL protein [Stappia indica]
MTADADAAEAGAPEEGAGRSKKKLLIFGGAGLVLLAAVGGGAYYFLMGGGESVAPDGTAPDAAVEQRPAVFFDLPEMTVNLSSEGRATYLRVRISLEVSDREMVQKIEPYLPRILDAFQVYLRELRPADLEGSSGLFRLKEELLRRINTAVYPARVEGVLFKEILVQ